MSRRVSGMWFAVGAAAAFSFSGTLGSGLMTAGWSAGATACARILVGVAVLLPLCLPLLRGRGGALRRGLPRMAVYGVLAVAGPQLAYFQAVRHLPVAVALLVEFTAPVAVLLWLWVTGGQRPSRTTVLGAVVAVVGLVIVLDLLSGVEVNVPGIAWALAAMVGLAIYFVLSSDDSHGLPPVVFATGGLIVAGLTLALALAVGVLDFHISSEPALFAVGEVPWWVTLLALGSLTSGAAYALGIAGARRLGSRLAGFVGLTEVLFASLVAWLLIGERPTLGHAVGGLLVLVGVALVKAGEPATATPEEAELAEVTPHPVVEGGASEVSQWPSASDESGRRGL